MAASTALLRIARRSLARDRWRTALIAVLIGLPVMGITTAALLLETALPTPNERATARMGVADLRLTPLGANRRAEVLSVVPEGSRIEPIWRSGDRVVIGGVRQGIQDWSMDPNGLATGMVELLAGSLPMSVDEVAISDRLATRAQLAVGDRLDLEAGGTFRITGIVEDPRDLSRLLAVHPVARAEAADLVPDWLVDLPPGSDPDAVVETIRTTFDPVLAGYDQPMFQAVTRADAREASANFTVLIVMLGAMALVESALVAAAAFAVGIRRRQRELGLLGAVGATPRQLAGSVMAEGLVAGIVSVVAGIGLGLLVAWLVTLRLDDLVGARTGPLELDPVVLGVAAVVGLVASIIAAGVPAWGAARLPTLVALSGRRPPSTPARRLLLLGLGLVALAFACTAVAPLLGRNNDVVPLALLVVGAVTGVLGFGACSPWLLERLEGIARRLPLSPRVALRDTARARTRNGPIVTAVLASVAATIALAAVLASQEAQRIEWWRPEVASDSMMIRGRTPETAAARVAQEMGAVGWGPDRWAEATDGTSSYQLLMPLRDPDPSEDRIENGLGIRVGDEGLLLAYHGDSALDAFRAGMPVVLESPRDAESGWALTGNVARLTRVEYDEQTGQSRRTDLGSMEVARVAARGGTDLSTVAIMPTDIAVAHGLDIDQGRGQVQSIVRLDHDLTQADLDRAGAIAMAVDADAYLSGPLPPPDPMLGFRLVMLVAAIVAALTVTAIAVALGEVEARSDLRTLVALGAPGGVRRRITASRGMVIAALAGLLAVPAGLLPVWGALGPLGWPIVVPIPEVIGALLVLPLAAVAGGWLLGRPLPEWAARRDVGA
ncbi:MAG: FtsX-like permease family protein [Chloroflexi bacterium]|nr:FtsX-like permease family protein [Chloroflexota bacterium]